MIYGCCALLNFMMQSGEAVDADRNDGAYDDPLHADDTNDVDDPGRAAPEYSMTATAVRARNKKKRDKLALGMFREYSGELQRRGRTLAAAPALRGVAKRRGRGRR
jgi:hypothetical protein